jgi:hypothetical protein
MSSKQIPNYTINERLIGERDECTRSNRVTPIKNQSRKLQNVISSALTDQKSQ